MACCARVRQLSSGGKCLRARGRVCETRSDQEGKWRSGDFGPLSSPGAPLTNLNDGMGRKGGGGGSDRGSYFIPKKSPIKNLSTQKNHYLFLACSKKSLSPFFATQKIHLFFSATQKNPGVLTNITKTPPSLI